MTKESPPQTTPITAENLLAAGYKEYPPQHLLHEHWDRAFQKRYLDDEGTLYFLTFHCWTHVQYLPTQWDAEVRCETKTGGYLWITLQEESIEAVEARAWLLWEAAGSVYYERNENKESNS